MVFSLNISLRGLADIVRAEGIVLVVYEDQNKITGETQRANGIGNADNNLPLDKVVTIEEAFADFRKNVVRFNDVVNQVATRQFRQNQHDALVKRAFNRGVTGFRVGEAALIERANAGDDRGVVNELVRDNNLERRIRESAMYVNGDYRDLYMVGEVRHDTPMVPLFRTNPKIRGSIEMIPFPMELLQ